MKITNNQQNTSFNSNVVVSFASVRNNMSLLAQNFAIEKGYVLLENAGTPIRLEDGLSYLVPDTSIPAIKILAEALDRIEALKQLFTGIDTDKQSHTALYAQLEGLRLDKASEIAKISQAKEIPFEDHFA